MIKSMAIGLVVLAAAACATPADDDTKLSTKERPVLTYTPPPITTIPWNEKATADEKLEALWPDSAETLQVLYRVGPDRVSPLSTSVTHTYLAFVVYDGAVQTVYLINTGSENGEDFHSAVDKAFQARTNLYKPNASNAHSGGTSGGTGTGKSPQPHPQVELADQIVIGPDVQIAAINAAAAHDAANSAFLAVEQ